MTRPWTYLWGAVLVAIALATGAAAATADAIRHSPIDPGKPKGETQ